MYRSHVAFGGHSPELFANAMLPDDCIADLEDWLEPDDVILVWANSNASFLSELWSRYASGSLPSLISAADKARSLSRKYKIHARAPFAMLSMLVPNLSNALFNSGYLSSSSFISAIFS